MLHAHATRRNRTCTRGWLAALSVLPVLAWSADVQGQAFRVARFGCTPELKVHMPAYASFGGGTRDGWIEVSECPDPRAPYLDLRFNTVEISSDDPDAVEICQGSCDDPDAESAGTQQLALSPSGTANFGIVTYPVTQAKFVYIRATLRSRLVRAPVQSQVVYYVLLLPPRIRSIHVNANPVVGGRDVTCQVEMTGKAPAGTVIYLSISNRQVVTCDGCRSGISVPAGQDFVQVRLRTQVVSRERCVSIQAEYDPSEGASPYAPSVKSTIVCVQPPRLVGLRLLQERVVGGNSATGEVVLDGPAPGPSGIFVALLSGDPMIASIPGNGVTIPPGATSATFPINTRGVAADVPVAIEAFHDGSVYAKTLTVLAASLVQLTLEGRTHLNLFHPPDNGIRVTGRVALNGAAPPDGAWVYFEYSGPVDADFFPPIDYPISITIPKGERAGSFNVTVYACPSSSDGFCDGRLTGSYQGRSASAVISVQGAASVQSRRFILPRLEDELEPDEDPDLILFRRR